MSWFRTLRRLPHDENGAALVYVTALLPLLLGAGVLVIDYGRLVNIENQVQNAADAAALAGARELDGSADSIDRAQRAAMQALANFQDFGDGGPAQLTLSTAACAADVVAPCMRFLSGLPTNDSDPIPASMVTTDPSEALFIEVRVAPNTMTGFFTAVVGTTEGDAPNRRAIAGNDPLICHMPPIFVCSPTGSTFNGPALAGRTIRSEYGGNGASGYSGGNFGLLCPAGTEDEAKCGASVVGAAMASASGTCFRLRELTTKTGATVDAVRTGMNVRLDKYDPDAKDKDGTPWRDQASYRPAANVTSGRPEPSPAGGTKCGTDGPKSSEEDFVQGLPADTCMDAGTCPLFNGLDNIGDAVWDLDAYVNVNHEGNDGFLAGLSNPTRFEVYRKELSPTPVYVQPGQDVLDSGGSVIGATLEDGAPSCYRGGTVTDTWDYFNDPDGITSIQILQDRRVFPVAIADCSTMASGKTTFTPIDYALVFLINGMAPSINYIDLEMIGTLGGDARQAMLRDVVQIYRR